MKKFALRLYFYPSPYGLDWSSPQTLGWTTLKNQFNRIGRTIGHVHVELTKYSENHQTIEEQLFTGMRQIDKIQERRLVLIKSVGLGVLFHDFKGRIETTEEIRPEIEHNLQTGRISVLTFWISESAYERSKKYLKEYLELGCANHYGLPNRPLHKEGAGCTAFSVSFLEVSGVFQDERIRNELTKNWSRTIFVPEKYTKNTNFLKILLSKKLNHWAKDSKDAKKIFFWDPDLMHRWVVNTWKSTTRAFELTPTKNQNSYVLECDLTRLPTPTESFWK